MFGRNTLHSSTHKKKKEKKESACPWECNNYWMLPAVCSCDWQYSLKPSYTANTFLPLTLETVITPEMEAICSRKMLEQLTTAGCRNLKEDHYFNAWNYLQCLAGSCSLTRVQKCVRMWLIHMNLWSQEKSQPNNHSWTQRTHTHTHTAYNIM